MTRLDYEAVHRAAIDKTGEDPVLMACAVALAGRWPDPQAVAGVLIHDDPRTVVQVVLNTLIGAAHAAAGRPVGSTVRGWDLPDDGAGAQPADAQEWPAEIVMEGGPNIIVGSREEYEYIRRMAAQNARLTARNEP